MKTPRQIAHLLLLCLVPLLLASCGGADPTQMAVSPRPMQAAQVAPKAALAPNVQYYDVVQHVYVAYFGRPADPGGLDFFATQFLNANAPTDVVGMAAAYDTNPNVRALIDFFGNSDESKALYPGDNGVFMDAVYHNLFSRDPDAGGKTFWSGLIDQGVMTRARAAVTIMANAQGTDITVINNKTLFASTFTTSLNTDTRIKAYGGLSANVVARGMLSNVTLTTDVGTAQSAVDATIATLVNTLNAGSYAPVAAIIQNRCVGCHSAHPTIPGFNPAPLGIKFDTSAQIHSQAQLIYDNAVQTEFMPYGNLTGMTEAERATVGAWFKLGAP